MKKLSHRSLLTISVSAVLLSLSGCVTAPEMPGAVVEAPQVKAPPPPTLVQQTPARPVGYFRKKVLDALQMP